MHERGHENPFAARKQLLFVRRALLRGLQPMKKRWGEHNRLGLSWCRPGVQERRILHQFFPLFGISCQPPPKAA